MVLYLLPEFQRWFADDVEFKLLVAVKELYEPMLLYVVKFFFCLIVIERQPEYD